MKFKVQVNPFTRKTVINAKLGKIAYTLILYYEDIEEWNSFEIGGKTFDIQFNYDAEFVVSIYPIIEKKIDYDNQCQVKLTFKMTE